MDLLCMFTQTALSDNGESMMIVAAPDLAAAHNLIAGYNLLLWGPCRIIKGARISGETRVVVGLTRSLIRAGRINFGVDHD